jgi:hypothetical protein
MFENIREKLAHRSGIWVAVTIFCVAAIAIYFSVRSTFGVSEAGSVSRDRLFICSETGKTFEHKLAEGETIPVHSPYSDKDTGYPAEFCYWTADGQIKDDPTPVLVNAYLGKNEPTFCPDCGRLVVVHNPAPMQGMKPPPMKEEYMKRRAPAAQLDRDGR